MERYDLVFKDGETSLVKDDTGEWIKYSDVEIDVTDKLLVLSLRLNSLELWLTESNSQEIELRNVFKTEFNNCKHLLSEEVKRYIENKLCIE